MSLLLQLPLIVGYRQILCTPLLKRQRALSRFGRERVPSPAAQSSCCPPNICSLYFTAFKISCLFKVTVSQQLLHAVGCVLQWEAVSCLRCAACATLEQ